MAELYLTDLCFEDNAEEQCERWLDECSKINDHFFELHSLKGSLRLGQNRKKEATESLLSAVTLLRSLDASSLPSTHSQVELCKLLLDVGELKSCKQVINDLLDLEEENESICEDWYIWYLLGQCYQQQSNFINALKCFSKAKKFATKFEIQSAVDDVEKLQQEVNVSLGASATSVTANINSDEPIVDDELSDYEDDEAADVVPSDHDEE
jgi:tetratricopeptide (TPR) repeat protein